VVFLTAKSGNEDRIRSLTSGAIEYIPKPFAVNDLKLRIAAILKNIEEQTEWQVEEMKRSLIEILSKSGKSGKIKDDYIFLKCRELGFAQRETEVAVLYSTGMSYKEIANRLFISEKTVSSHIQRILAKTNTNNRLIF